MKRYAVFTESKFVPTHELSLSKKITERETVLDVLKIVREWVDSIYPDTFIVYCKGNDITISNFSIYPPPEVVKEKPETKKMGLVPVFCPSNIKFRIGVFETKYITKPVD